jgi:hypothetical protein
MSLGLSRKEVENIVRHFLSFANDNMNRGAFEGTRFPYLGSIKPRLDFIQMWYEVDLPRIYYKKKNEDKSGGRNT